MEKVVKAKAKGTTGVAGAAGLQGTLSVASRGRCRLLRVEFFGAFQ